MTFTKNSVLCVAVTWLMVLGFAACTPAPKEEFTPSAPPSSQLVEIERSGVTVTLQTPPGWYLYRTDERIILSEQARPIATNGTLDGITITISLPDVALEDAEIEATLERIINSDELRRLPVSVPQTFSGEFYDAGHYLVNVGRENVTFVLVLSVASSQQLVTVNVSTAQTDLDRVRSTLVTVLDALQIDGQSLDEEVLQQLPRIFNVPESNPGAAMEASSEP